MSKSNVVVAYHNIHPSEETKEFIDSVIQEIHHELPAGSIIKAKFSAKDHAVKALLNVRSYGGPFFAVGTSTSAREVAMQLLEQMRRHIDKFKSKTHRRKSLKNIPLKQGYRDSEIAS